MSGDACAMAIAPHNQEGDQVFYYSIFPNMLLSMHPDYVMVHQLWPQSPERTLIVCDWFFHPDAFDRNDFRPEDAIEFWDVTNKQDWHVCELSQQGIASRAYEPGPYSSRESIPAAWDREYLRRMGRGKRPTSNVQRPTPNAELRESGSTLFLNSVLDVRRFLLWPVR
jgi:phenylpropionate dioxygenase-like ring-hydroxylating dioxygenase large terminal subunit